MVVTFVSPKFNLLTRRHLLCIKTKVLRSGVWFKVMQRIDRVLFDLTIRVIANIRSVKLAKSILSLTEKLENAVESNFLNLLYEVGLPIARKISSIALKLGKNSANGWAFDYSFIWFLAVMQINNRKTLN